MIRKFKLAEPPFCFIRLRFNMLSDSVAVSSGLSEVTDVYIDVVRVAWALHFSHSLTRLSVYELVSCSFSESVKFAEIFVSCASECILTAGITEVT